ncbi:hypothetical protein FRB99_000834 [Tulasnella sp. 403]|nr:hypothetical protein FRB99_000834 [Tulasnella sp. 403]
MPTPPSLEVPNGFYILRNKRTKTCLDLDGGRNHNGNKIQGWSRFGSFLPNSLWFIEKQTSGGYSIRNARTGNAMDLDYGKKDNGTRVQGYRFMSGNPNQYWDLIDKGGYYSYVNAQWKIYVQQTGALAPVSLSSTLTFFLATFLSRSSDNGAEAQCASYAKGDDNQLWLLDHRSRTANEIQCILQANSLLSGLFERSKDNKTQYLILPSRLREDIYVNSGLDKRIRRPKVFDFEDYVIKSKDAVTSWVRDNITFNRGGALFGIVYGSQGGGQYTYNWTLTKDCQSVMFFDAYSGDELTTASLEQLGFKARFGTF